jgi:hypothetical protein
LEGDSKEDILSVLPLQVRPQAKIVELARFSMDDVDKVLDRHHD